MLPRQLALSDLSLSNDRKKLMDKVINDEKDCFTKLKLKIRKFFIWWYNRQ
jgi:hypothetical protein